MFVAVFIYTIATATRIKLPVNRHHLMLTQEQVYFFLHLLAALGRQCEYFYLHTTLSSSVTVRCHFSACGGSARHRQEMTSNCDLFLFSCFFLGKELAIRRDGTRRRCSGRTESCCCDKHSDCTLHCRTSHRHDAHG